MTDYEHEDIPVLDPESGTYKFYSMDEHIAKLDAIPDPGPVSIDDIKKMMGLKPDEESRINPLSPEEVMRQYSTVINEALDEVASELMIDVDERIQKFITDSISTSNNIEGPLVPSHLLLVATGVSAEQAICEERREIQKRLSEIQSSRDFVFSCIKKEINDKFDILMSVAITRLIETSTSTDDIVSIDENLIRKFLKEVANDERVKLRVKTLKSTHLGKFIVSVDGSLIDSLIDSIAAKNHATVDTSDT